MIYGTEQEQVESKLARWLGLQEQQISLHYVLLGGILVLTVALRFFSIGQWSFWGDEFITVRNALNMDWHLAFLKPLSLILTRVSLDIWGLSEASARLAAAVIGILTVPVLYLLARKMSHVSVAILASLLLAVAPWHIYWSQNARFYTALLLFFTIALFFFYLALEHDKIIYLLASMLFLFLAIQERLIGAFLIPVIVLYIIFLKVLPFQTPPGLRWRNLVIFFLPGLLGAAYLILTHPAIRDLSQWDTAFSFVNNSPLWLVGGFAFYLGIPVVCLAALGAIRLLMRWDRLGLLLSLAAIIPILALTVLSLFQYTANRYAFVSVTSILLLAAFALFELFAALKNSQRLLGLGILALVVLSAMGDNFLYFQYQNGNRDDWQAAFAYIDQRRDAGDRVVTTHPELAQYYLNDSALSMMAIDDPQALAARDGRTWFILDLTAPDKAPGMFHWIIENATYQVEFDVTFGARTWPMRVYLYE
jgi:mannosyltransferase